jgi:hypothetical protein
LGEECEISLEKAKELIKRSEGLGRIFGA